MQRIRTLVVDDEPEAREGLLRLLHEDPTVEVVGECTDGRAAVDAIARLHPDVVFLDIQMPELDGFGVLAALDPAVMPAVIFVTAYDEYALRAFEAHALDYLLKPYSDERFAAALRQAQEHVQQRRVSELGRKLAALLQDHQALGSGGDTAETEAGTDGGSADAAAGAPSKEPAAPIEYLDRVVVRHARNVSFVRVDEIDWIGAADYYAKLHVGGRTHLIRETMQQLETKLDPRRFVRIHRSAIVNVDRVKLIQPYFRGGHVVVLHDNTRLIMSRGRREALERVLGQPI